MELNKKKYKKAEVEAIINAEKAKYESQIIELSDKIRDLIGENNDLKLELEIHTDREDLILSTLARAEITAKEIERNAELRYELEVERLKNFTQKWNDYFNELKDKYPLYPTIRKAVGVKEKFDSLTDSNAKPKDIIEQLDKDLNAKKKFDPKKKIEDYIATTEDNGFNMEEVLNPGSLKLEDLCKELGLIEENE